MTLSVLLVALVGGLVVLGGLVVVGVLALGRRSRLGYDQQNQLVPGRAPVVPSSWAGSHDPEAVQHRRLVAALDGMRRAEAAAGGALDAGAIDLRVQVLARAEDLDRRLVAASVLPADARARAQQALTAEVTTVVEVAGSLGQRLALGGASPDAPALPVLQQRLLALDGPDPVAPDA